MFCLFKIASLFQCHHFLYNINPVLETSVTQSENAFSTLATFIKNTLSTDKSHVASEIGKQINRNSLKDRLYAWPVVLSIQTGLISLTVDILEVIACPYVNFHRLLRGGPGHWRFSDSFLLSLLSAFLPLLPFLSFTFPVTVTARLGFFWRCFVRRGRSCEHIQQTTKLIHCVFF